MEEALFKAAEKGDNKFLDGIGDQNDILTKQNHQGDTACHVSLQHGHLNFALKMVSLCPPILYKSNAEGDTVLHCALKNGQQEFFVECMKCLKKYLERISSYKYMILGDLDDIEKEKENFRNAVRNKEGKCLAYIAAENGYVDALRILLETPLMSRTRGPNGEKALHAAVRERKYDVIPVLLQYQPELSAHLDRNGHTPLHLAVMLNDRRMIELFVNGSQPDVVSVLNKDGISPFHLSAASNNLEIFEFLLQLRPECHRVTTSHGQNVLHLAVKENATAIVEFIVKDKKLTELMINQQDNDGNTPLHIAANGDDEKMMNTLLDSQVRVLPLKNKENQTFGDISKAHKARKQKEITEKMQSRLLKAMEDFHSSLLVMATLITTVTFTAAFTMPGGYKSGADPGAAVLLAEGAFKVFLVSDTISMCSSIIAAAGLIIFSVIFGTEEKLSVLKAAIGSIAISVLFMLVAFATGVWVAIGSWCSWLAIIIVVATSCTPLVPALVYGPIIMVTFEKKDED